MVRWLVSRFPDNVSLFESDADKEKVKEIISLVLPKAEVESFSKQNLSFEKWIQQAKGKSLQNDLQWLIGLFDHASLSSEIRDHLYDSLKLYISWQVNEQTPSRTFARSLSRKIFYHKTELQKQVSAEKLITNPIDKTFEISNEEKIQLADTAKGILCMLLRETDPVTYADTEAIELFSMGRGIDIALYYMLPERRLPFDSYIGYIAFKNRLPIAYGGGWVFQQRSKSALMF
jgi:hypothetical protein